MEINLVTKGRNKRAASLKKKEDSELFACRYVCVKVQEEAGMSLCTIAFKRSVIPSDQIIARHIRFLACKCRLKVKCDIEAKDTKGNSPICCKRYMQVGRCLYRVHRKWVRFVVDLLSCSNFFLLQFIRKNVPYKKILNS